MRKLIITLEITQSDVVAEYAVVDKELVFDDLKLGDLIEFCNIVNVEVKNALSDLPGC